MNIPFVRFYFLSVCVVVALFTSCSNKQESPVQLGIQNQILHKGNGDEPAGLDPHTTTGMPEYHIQMAVFEGLVSKDPNTLETIPAVAESWTVSDDGLIYTFKIRDNAKWSNGAELTAEDFVWSWMRGLLPNLGNQYAYSLYVIKNAEAFHKGDISDFNEVGVKALDKQTLEVTLGSFTPYFLLLLDHHSMFPVYRPAIEKVGDIDDRGSRWVRPETFVGNGAFSLKEWVPNKVLVVEKNKYYWDAGVVKLNEIHFHPIQQVTTEERMYRAGQLHVTNIIPTEKIEGYSKRLAPEYRGHPYFGTYFYNLNITVKPLDDVRVRKALSYSIDREKLVEKVTKGGQIPAFNLTPPDTLGYTSEARGKFDIEEARKLLAEAGYPNGEGFPKLEVLFNTHEDHRKVAVAIQQMWKTALNINVTLQNQDWKVFLDSQRSLDYQISRASWIGDYFDPNTFLDLYLTDGGNNKTGWTNSDYDALIAKAAKTSNAVERHHYFQQAEAILVDEVPIIPIYTYTRNYLAHPSLNGWDDNILDYHPYKYLYFSQESK